MAGQRWLLALALAGVMMLAVATALVLAFGPLRPSDPMNVVERWVDARNRGDVDASMDLLADSANVFGISVQLPEARDEVRAIFTAQAAAGWTVEDSGCTVDGEEVRCRYVQHDRILDRWGLAFTGKHRYVVRNGKVAMAERIHDPASRDAVYGAIEAFRAWARRTHPEEADVIWSTPGAALYTTPEGARAALDLLDEYEAASR